MQLDTFNINKGFYIVEEYKEEALSDNVFYRIVGSSDKEMLGSIVIADIDFLKKINFNNYFVLNEQGIIGKRGDKEGS